MVPELAQHYGFVALFLVVAFIFPLLPIVMAKFVAPSKGGPLKMEPYECGVEPSTDAWIAFRIGYYFYALIFIVFDVETLFLYAWAVVFKDLGLFGVIEMGIFLVILTWGLVYAWNKRALEWE
jgi:NADH-quinone oxidoreductase subunit A